VDVLRRRDRCSKLSKGNVCRRKERKKTEKEMVGCD